VPENSTFSLSTESPGQIILIEQQMHVLHLVATPMVVPDADQPTSFSLRLVLPSLGAQARNCRAHTFDTTSTSHA